jgi:SPP1 gp7 family putative phage head morphogenesis protein
MAVTAPFLRRHKQHERRVARVIASFFTGQARRIVTGLRDNGAITTAAVSLVFRRHNEHAAFMKLVTPQLATTAVREAIIAYNSVPKKRPRKADDVLSDELKKLLKDKDAGLVGQIEGYLRELVEAPFWEEIQAATEKTLIDIIAKGVKDGLSDKQLAKSISTELGGAMSRKRALTIARTEVTGMMNAAHYATQELLGKAGLITGRVWSATLDKSVRRSHYLMHGTEAKPGEPFMVAGKYPTPHPGHWSLPAHERVHCRCTTISNGIWNDPEFLEEPVDPQLAALVGSAGE